MSEFMDPMEDLKKNDELALLSQVAHMYYDLGMLQPEIAEQLFFSRSKVSRMLQKAQDLGIVEITVKRYLARNPGCEQRLKSLFGLKKALVMTDYDDVDHADSREGVANCAALYVSGMLKGDCVMGITGSGTVTNVVRRLKKVHDCNLQVVQTIGATINKDMSGELVNFIAKTYGGSAHFLNTPLYVDDVYVKESLLKDPAIMEASKLMKRCSLLLMSIGKFDLGGDMPNWWGYMTARHRQEMAQMGAVGSACAMFFDINGNLLDCEWNRKCITIPWEDMKNADLRVVVASGKHKVDSILGALRGNLIDVLITNNMTAIHVIEKQLTMLREKE